MSRFRAGWIPSGILTLKRVIQHLSRRKQATIVLTSPVPELVEEVATRIVVLRDGEILAFETLDGLQLLTGASRHVRPGARAADLSRDDEQAGHIFPGVRAMIRRVLGRLLRVAPPTWAVSACILIFLVFEGPAWYLKWKWGLVDLPNRPGVMVLSFASFAAGPIPRACVSSRIFGPPISAGSRALRGLCESRSPWDQSSWFLKIAWQYASLHYWVEPA